MSDYIDTRDGSWREVAPGEVRNDRESLRHETETTVRTWVREEPVPPLPTESNTVIEVTYEHSDMPVKAWLDEDTWRTKNGPLLMTAGGSRITGFEVLAEPTPRVALYQEQERVTRDVTERVRRETAKAVLHRVRGVHHSAGDLSIPARFRLELDVIGRDFGVES